MAELFGVLFAGVAFDAAGDIDGVRTNKTDGIGDVFGGQAAGEDDGDAGVKAGEEIPGCDTACAAVLARDVTIEQDGGRQTARGTAAVEVSGSTLVRLAASLMAKAGTNRQGGGGGNGGSSPCHWIVRAIGSAMACAWASSSLTNSTIGSTAGGKVRAICWASAGPMWRFEPA